MRVCPAVAVLSGGEKLVHNVRSAVVRLRLPYHSSTVSQNSFPATHLDFLARLSSGVGFCHTGAATARFFTLSDPMVPNKLGSLSN